MEGYSRVPPAADSLSRSFFYQYTALMLIIITLVVGSFARQKNIASAAQTSREAQRLAVAIKPLAVMEYEHLFRTGSAEIEQPEVIGAVNDILQRHDIDASITVAGDKSSDASTDQSALAMARAQLMYRNLRALNPEGTFRVYARARIASEAQMEVRFER